MKKLLRDGQILEGGIWVARTFLLIVFGSLMVANAAESLFQNTLVTVVSGVITGLAAYLFMCWRFIPD